MRKREAHHQAQLDSIPSLATSGLPLRFSLDHHHADHIASEVLATLVLNRVGQTRGVTDAAAEALIKRIQSLVGKRWQGMKGRPEVLRRGGQAFEDVLDYVWDKLLEEKGPFSNAEFRFAVFVRDRVDDFLRHLRTEKNSMDSVDGMGGDDDSATLTADDIADDNAETPEEALMRKQQSAKVNQVLIDLPKHERDAFYFREEFKYEWARVAKLLDCSVPTARKYRDQAMNKLKGAME
jgi:RNA polymerase sigma factor (sigma-70 family)